MLSFVFRIFREIQRRSIWVGLDCFKIVNIHFVKRGEISYALYHPLTKRTSIIHIEDGSISPFRSIIMKILEIKVHWIVYTVFRFSPHQ